MKKTSSIILTLLLSLSINISTAQNNFDPNNCPTDTICNNNDTIYCDCELPEIRYNYYFRINFFDKIFRLCFPHKYYNLVYASGHVNRTPLFSSAGVIKHHRHAVAVHLATIHHGGYSSKRGGFGSTGSSRSQSS